MRAPTPTTPSPYAVLRWLVLATFIVILNETIMINAIPRLMVEFDVTARDAQWLSTAFMLTMATVIPVTGWFLQRVTTRTAFTVAMATFMTGTLISALAPVFWLLVSGRVVQAAGTAVMMPLLMTTLMTVVPEHDRGRVMGNVTLAISVAPALGPTISGVVLQWTSWRWLFGLVLPIALVISVLALRRLVNVGETKPGAIDWLSVVLAGLGFGGLVYGLSGLGEGAASAVPPVALVAAGLLLIGLFALRQLQPAEARRAAARPAHAGPPHLHAEPVAAGGLVPGDAGRDDPAAALPPGRPRALPAADRPAWWRRAASRWVCWARASAARSTASAAVRWWCRARSASWPPWS